MDCTSTFPRSLRSSGPGHPRRERPWAVAALLPMRLTRRALGVCSLQGQGAVSRQGNRSTCVAQQRERKPNRTAGRDGDLIPQEGSALPSCAARHGPAGHASWSTADLWRMHRHRARARPWRVHPGWHSRPAAQSPKSLRAARARIQEAGPRRPTSRTRATRPLAGPAAEGGGDESQLACAGSRPQIRGLPARHSGRPSAGCPR